MLWFDLADSILIKCFRLVGKWLLHSVLMLWAQPDIKNDFLSDRIRIWWNFWGEKNTKVAHDVSPENLRQKFIWRVVSHSIWHHNVINQKRIVSIGTTTARIILLKNCIQLNVVWWIVPVFSFFNALITVAKWQDRFQIVGNLSYIMSFMMLRVNSIRCLRQIWDNFLEVWPLFKYGCT